MNVVTFKTIDTTTTLTTGAWDASAPTELVIYNDTPRPFTVTLRVVRMIMEGVSGAGRVVRIYPENVYLPAGACTRVHVVCPSQPDDNGFHAISGRNAKDYGAPVAPATTHTPRPTAPATTASTDGDDDGGAGELLDTVHFTAADIAYLNKTLREMTARQARQAREAIITRDYILDVSSRTAGIEQMWATRYGSSTPATRLGKLHTDGAAIGAAADMAASAAAASAVAIGAAADATSASHRQSRVTAWVMLAFAGLFALQIFTLVKFAL